MTILIDYPVAFMLTLVICMGFVSLIQAITKLRDQLETKEKVFFFRQRMDLKDIADNLENLGAEVKTNAALIKALNFYASRLREIEQDIWKEYSR